ncbi:MAG TPA: GldG family protein [Candidatus Binatus sp.]|nr:GldG family protein [Candidatus Binatus sp.]
MRLARAVRGWSQLALQVVLLLLALGLLQLVAERTNRRFDLTPGRALSLSPLTRKLLAEVTRPLKVTVFFRRGTREQYAELLERFHATNPHIDFELYDLDRFPERGRSLGVTQYGRAAIQYEGRRVVVLASPEAELAGGILRALRGNPRRIVFTTGHGERAPSGTSESYGRLINALEAENYAPEDVSLLDGPLPPETAIVVVAGPKHDFLPLELDALAAYLKAGGGVLLLLDPGSLPNVSRFLASMGVVLGDDFVVERERRILGTDGLAAVVELFKRGNPVSDPEANPIESGVVLPSARTVDVLTQVPGVEAESIARTTPSSWTMADPARAQRGEEPSQAQHDVPGSASVVVMVELGGGDGTGRRGRLVAIGDADFASDAYLDLLGNRDLALNAIAWVAGEDVLTGARTPNVPEVMRPLSPLVLTERQARTVFIASVLIGPGLVLGFGLVVAGVRRYRG